MILKSSIKTDSYFIVALWLWILQLYCVKKHEVVVLNVEIDNFNDFKWSIVKKSEITVEAINGEDTRVEIYSSNSMQSESLIALGAATLSKPFVAGIDFPANLETVFVKSISCSGKVVVDSYDVHSMFASKVEMSKSVEAFPVFQIENPVVPSNFDVTLTSSSESVTLLGDKTYIIPKGETYTANINGYNWQGGFATLYVAGKLQVNSLSLGYSGVVVLDGGEIVVNSLSGGNNEKGATTLFVAQGGIVNAKSLSSNSYNQILNKGNINVDKLSLAASSVLANTGSIKGLNQEGIASFDISNHCILHSSGVMKSVNMELNTNAKFYNYEDAQLDVFGNLEFTNQSADLYNYGGFINVSNELFVQGKLENYGYIGCDILSGSKGEFNLASGSLVESRDTRLNNAVVNMQPNSLYVTRNMCEDVFYATKFNNDNEDGKYALVVVSEGGLMKDNRWSQVKYDGLIEICYHLYDKESSSRFGVTEYAALEECSCLGGAFFTKTQVNSVTESKWNKDYSAGGAGGNEPIFPEDPEVTTIVYFPSATEYASVAFEDHWSYIGDYDMNDIVVDFRVSKCVNAEGNVLYLDVDWMIRAAGTSRDLAMGIQLDKIAAGAAAQIIRTGEATYLSGVIGDSRNGFEDNQSKVVFALFNSVTDVYGEDGKRINTSKKAKYREPSKNKVRLVFDGGVASNDITIETINFFVVSNSPGEQVRGSEIHLCNYKATDLGFAFSSTDVFGKTSKVNRYKSEEGKPWGIMIPKSFVYPQELVSIENGYTLFKTWYESLGQQAVDWYEDKVGYRNYDVLYY